MNQEQWEYELLSYAAQLQPEHVQHLVRVHAESGPDGVLRELAGTGLSRGALEVAASTINGAGFEGAVQVTQGRLQEVASVNIERECGQWMAANGIVDHPGATSKTQQVVALQNLAAQQKTTPIEAARNAGLIPDAAERAAQAVRAQRGDAKVSRMQRALESPAFHRAAAGLGKSGPALLKELQALARLGDFETIQKKAPGMFKNESDARRLLGDVATIGATDRLVAEMDEHDGEVRKAGKADREDGWGLSEEWNKAQPRAQREARPPSEAPLTGDDDWGLNAAWDAAGGGPELASGTITGHDSEAA